MFVEQRKCVCDCWKRCLHTVGVGDTLSPVISACVVLHCSNVLLRRRDHYELVNKRAQCRNYHQWRKSADASFSSAGRRRPPRIEVKYQFENNSSLRCLLYSAMRCLMIVIDKVGNLIIECILLYLKFSIQRRNVFED